jgi:hypothetical protein
MILFAPGTERRDPGRTVQVAATPSIFQGLLRVVAASFTKEISRLPDDRMVNVYSAKNPTVGASMASASPRSGVFTAQRLGLKWEF